MRRRQFLIAPVQLLKEFTMQSGWKRLTGDEGQDLLEYALLAAILSVGCILSIQALTGGVIPFFDRVLAALTAL